jgi:hypothetical protein
MVLPGVRIFFTASAHRGLFIVERRPGLGFLRAGHKEVRVARNRAGREQVASVDRPPEVPPRTPSRRAAWGCSRVSG